MLFELRKVMMEQLFNKTFSRNILKRLYQGAQSIFGTKIVASAEAALTWAVLAIIGTKRQNHFWNMFSPNTRRSSRAVGAIFGSTTQPLAFIE